MSPFPAVDPIPLPAPIWLFKLLHIVTLSLHFLAMQMLLGGLLLAVVLSLFPSALSQVAARALARRLTVVMTFVINLAVPPLLFAQVLYGRSLYTSSVLIGLYWISIIVLLMLVYWLLYKFSARLEAGRSGWWIGLSAWLVAGFIARLLSSNMTLMLRPDVWRRMYSASAAGAYLPTGDPTLTPRWLLMLAGGLFVGGLWMVYLAGRSTFTAEEKHFVAGLGGKVAALFGLVYLAAGLWAAGVQPAIVKAGLAAGTADHPVYRFAGIAGYGWLALVAIALVAAGICGVRPHRCRLAGMGLRCPSPSGRDYFHRLPRRRARPDPPQQGLRCVGQGGCYQLERGWAFPGSVCRRPGNGWLADLCCRARAKADGRSCPMSSHIVLDDATLKTLDGANGAGSRRGFLVAAGAAGLCYVAALGYPVYRYLASPAEMAASEGAVTEVTLKDARNCPPAPPSCSNSGLHRPCSSITRTTPGWRSPRSAPIWDAPFSTSPT